MKTTMNKTLLTTTTTKLTEQERQAANRIAKRLCLSGTFTSKSEGDVDEILSWATEAIGLEGKFHAFRLCVYKTILTANPEYAKIMNMVPWFLKEIAASED